MLCVNQKLPLELIKIWIRNRIKMKDEIRIRIGMSREFIVFTLACGRSAYRPGPRFPRKFIISFHTLVPWCDRIFLTKLFPFYVSLKSDSLTEYSYMVLLFS